MSRVLVTGGSGFIGTHLVRWLVADATDVVVLDLVPPREQLEGVTYILGDVRDADAVRSALEGCTEVWHLAAAHHDFGIARETYFSVNQQGTQVLAEVMGELGIRRLCFFSSVAVYGAGPEPHVETALCKPETPYGESKLAGEAVLQRWSEAEPGREVLVIRPAVVFGPGHTANVFSLLRQIERGLYVHVGAASNIKSLAYVDNLLDAVLFVWRGEQRANLQVFNYTDEPALSSRAIADALSVGLGFPPPRLTVPLGLILVACVPLDLVIKLTGWNLPISSARVRKLFVQRTAFPSQRIRATGFRQQVSTIDGLSRMAAWFRAEGRAIGPVAHRPPAEIWRAAKPSSVTR